MVFLPLFFPTSLLPSWGVLGLLCPIIFQFTFFQLTIFPKSNPKVNMKWGLSTAKLKGSGLGNPQEWGQAL